METIALIFLAIAILAGITVSASLLYGLYGWFVALVNFAKLPPREIEWRIECAFDLFVAVLVSPALMTFGGHGGGLLTRFRWGLALVCEILLAASAANELVNNDNGARFLYCVAMFLFAGIAYIAAWSLLGREAINLIRPWKDGAILERILVIVALPMAVYLLIAIPLDLLEVLK